ncbi:hypothetical protein [Aequorivita lipolytica]|uniref:C1q domain-containing protein n=1 Tax=Aequorivita lipolytica TaxID=153267 RepID=A0A5C6YS11_9FLAO|nr:hypothetical protein [Aequorivita lipolytica]TXD69805.1 hypothetical protein ESV24_05025 [Aequorivita lipolytica]SRX50384.1 hypothetical protein AEQU2_00856 [Aequorivita lipolytica]
MIFPPQLVQRLLFFILIFSFFIKAHSQVAIGTTNPDDGSAFEIESTTAAFVPPRMTTAQMLAIPTPLKGATIFNTSTDTIFVFNGTAWKNQLRATVSTLTLYRDFSGSETINGNSTFNNFTIGAVANEIKSIDTDIFEVLGDGKIKVKVDGVYQFSAGLNVRNFNGTASGSARKFIIAIFKNNIRYGYFSRGFAFIPSASEYWGTSGVFQAAFSANDVIDVQYYLDNSSAGTLSVDYMNIGVILVQ